ncbi:nuclear transport factor 2 family protein [Sabulilitoribacter multivorans]|uniref:Nuclear transport factor 2 family protein n=1 Tax=Flaviramulus multivorans TaxID=1304750 RepID=A0ABS9IM47_9FLAO|nr:nuclear transport factor 2 family protein [Flaviramulus multivorans]MCF7561676.1 nuclear transport factor 2 family protein [Flaviramulus multivorans]
MKILTIYISLFLCFGNIVTSQETNHLKAINTDVWSPFTKAFETFDYILFASIHSEDLVRVSGDSKNVKGKTTYIEGYKKRWVNKNSNQTISFRFLERIANDISASERGIYKLTVNPNTANEQSYYGKFHVILRKENGTWKLLVDYDSSESNTINETSYNEAFAIDDFDKY